MRQLETVMHENTMHENTMGPANSRQNETKERRRPTRAAVRVLALALLTAICVPPVGRPLDRT